MKTKILMMLMMMFVSMGAFAQSNEPLEGDVNNDGKVDVADIVKVIDIMQNSAPQPAVTYYWYVGQTNPTTIDTIVDDNDMSSPGWRRIGNSLPDYNSSNMLWNGVEKVISFSERDYSYIAVPYKPLQMWDITGNDGMFYTIQNNGDGITINGVTYYIYKSDYKTRAFQMNIYNK